jgi:hypothetical protein
MNFEFPGVRRFTRAASNSLSRLAFVAAVSLGFPPALADNTDGPCVPGTKIWQPAPGSTQQSVPASEALQRITEQYQFLMARDNRERTYRNSTLAQILQKYGLTDTEQSILLSPGGANWAVPPVGISPYWNVAARMSDDFYKKNLQPLLRSAEALRKVLREQGSQSAVIAADLDYMEDRMARLRAFEPTLQSLRTAALELDGQMALVQIEAVRDREAWARMSTTFNINSLAPSSTSGLIGRDESEALRRLQEFATQRQQREADWQEKERVIAGKGQEIFGQYQSLQSQFTVEFGKRAALPDCPVQPPAGATRFPDNAVPD